MASVLKIGDSWKAQVAVKGVRKSMRFDTKAEAQVWASTLESELNAGRTGKIPPNKTYKDLLLRYIDEVIPTKLGGDGEARRIMHLINSDDALPGVKLAYLDAPDVAAWRNRRLKEVSAATVRREWNTLSHACTIAKKEWKWLASNPFKDVTRPAPPESRHRVIEDHERDAILLALGCSPFETPINTSGRVGIMFLFCLETGMRSGEALSLRWRDIEEKTAMVRAEEKGARKSDRRKVPLSQEARRLLTLLPSALREEGGDDDSVFEISEGSRDQLFRRAVERAGLENIHFHDTRRTALTHLSQKVEVMTLAKISGHRDLKMLLNTYYAPDMDNVADRLG